MKTTTQLAILAVASLGLLMASLPAQADNWLPTTNPGPHAAQINGSPGARSRDLFDVQFVAMNGQNIPSRGTVWLPPGRYTLTVQIIADGLWNPAPMRRTRDEPGYNTIEVMVEAGKIYEIRAKHNRRNPRSPFTVILHRVIE